MRATTSSGAIYEFTKDMGKFRRLRKRNPIDPEAETLRVERDGDGKWLPIFDMKSEPKVGEPMSIMVDEEDTPGITVWNTSVVVGVEQ